MTQWCCVGRNIVLLTHYKGDQHECHMDQHENPSSQLPVRVVLRGKYELPGIQCPGSEDYTNNTSLEFARRAYIPYTSSEWCCSWLLLDYKGLVLSARHGNI